VQQIEDYYADLTIKVNLIKEGYAKCLFVVGEAGIGKTTQIMEQLKGTQHVKIGGYLSPLKLYRLLFKYRNDYIVYMDDTESIVDNPSCLILLKQGLDTHEPRQITWETSSGRIKVPHTYDFTSRIIFCLNRLPEDEGFKALIDRSEKIFLNFKYHDKIIIMYQIATKQRKIKNYTLSPEERKAIVDFIQANIKDVSNISLRTQYKIENYYVYSFNNKKTDWKQLAIKLLSE